MSKPRSKAQDRKAEGKHYKALPVPEAIARYEGILLVSPEHLDIPDRPYRDPSRGGKKNENQLGQLIRWLLGLTDLRHQDFCLLTGLTQQTLYRNSRLDTATMTGVHDVALAIRRYLGHDQFIIFETAWDLAHRPDNTIPSVWMDVARNMAVVLRNAWEAHLEPLEPKP